MYIEVTDRESGYRLLCPLSRILCIVESADGAFIETSYERGKSRGIITAEKYEEIKAKIERISGGVN